MVSCDGAAFYMAALGYGASWRTLLADVRIAVDPKTLPPARTAADFQAERTEGTG